MQLNGLLAADASATGAMEARDVLGLVLMGVLTLALWFGFRGLRELNPEDEKPRPPEIPPAGKE
jgi:hypothetical protein